MKRTVLAIALIGAAGFAMADLKAEIAVMSAKVEKAFMKKDINVFVAAVKPNVTKDFKHIENGTTRNFDQMVQTMKQGLAMMQKISGATTKTVSLKINGNTATAVTAHTMSGTMVDQEKKTHSMKFTGTSTDLYRKEGGKWKLAKMTWSKQKMYIDGKDTSAAATKN